MVTQTYHRRGSGDPPAAGRFVIFLKKKTILMPLDHISQMFRTICRNNILTVESQKLHCSSSFYLQFKSKTRLKSCILVLNFVSDLAQAEESKVHCLLHYFNNK